MSLLGQAALAFGTVSLAGLVFYVLLCAPSYWLWFKREGRTVNREYVEDPGELRRSFGWTALSIVSNALMLVPVHLAVQGGWSRVYWDVADHGWGWLLLSIGLYLVVTETLVYWTHRLLHRPWAFRRIHFAHHSFRKPTPWASLAFHPLDAFLQALPHHLCAFLFPVHGLVYLGFLGFVTAWSVAIHDRVSLVRWPWLNFTAHHTVHHFYNNYNHGQFFTLWDRLAGSYRAPDARFLEPGDAGTSSGDSGSDANGTLMGEGCDSNGVVGIARRLGCGGGRPSPRAGLGPRARVGRRG